MSSSDNMHEPLGDLANLEPSHTEPEHLSDVVEQAPLHIGITPSTTRLAYPRRVILHVWMTPLEFHNMTTDNRRAVPSESNDVARSRWESALRDVIVGDRNVDRVLVELSVRVRQ